MRERDRRKTGARRRVRGESWGGGAEYREGYGPLLPSQPCPLGSVSKPDKISSLRKNCDIEK